MRDCRGGGVLNDEEPDIVKNQDSKDDALSNVLRDWRTDAMLPPGFQQGVWRIIDQKKCVPRFSPMEFLHLWLTGFVSRPAVAAAYVGALIFVGFTAGWSQGQRDSTRLQGELASRYVQSLDPYQVPRP